MPANGPDLLQNFVLPIDIPEDKLVAAVEFHPGNKRVVHHAVLFLDDKGQARKLDAATPSQGMAILAAPDSYQVALWEVGPLATQPGVFQTIWEGISRRGVIWSCKSLPSHGQERG